MRITIRKTFWKVEVTPFFAKKFYRLEDFELFASGESRKRVWCDNLVKTSENDEASFTEN